MNSDKKSTPEQAGGAAKLRFRVLGVKLHETLDEAQVQLVGCGHTFEVSVTTAESYWYAARLNQSVEFSGPVVGKEDTRAERGDPHVHLITREGLHTRAEAVIREIGMGGAGEKAINDAISFVQDDIDTAMWLGGRERAS